MGIIHRSVAILGVIVALAGCGGGTSDTPVVAATTGDGGSNNASTLAIVSTLAGNGTAGAMNGVGPVASFSYPESVAVDAQGNVYVADTNNHLIRKITPAGVVSTLAGSGAPGRANGTGTAASFSFPLGVSVDARGYVYVADSGNNLIRLITPSGTVSTIAGSGAVSGASDGIGTAASFSYPHGIAVSMQGNVYVGDLSNNVVRKITPDGVVSTLAGNGKKGFADGTGAMASFNGPWGGAVDAQENVYVGDSGNYLIRKITPAGAVSTFAGSGIAGSANGIGTAASFNGISNIAVDKQGTVFVAAPGLNQIRTISPAGVVSTYAGSGAAGAANGSIATASFKFPLSVAVDSQGTVYVADSANNLIRKITPD